MNHTKPKYGSPPDEAGQNTDFGTYFDKLRLKR